MTDAAHSARAQIRAHGTAHAFSEVTITHVDHAISSAEAEAVFAVAARATRLVRLDTC